MRHRLLVTVALLLRAAAAADVTENKDKEKCFYDDRMSSVRCRDADFALIVASLNGADVDVVALDVNMCNVPEVKDTLVWANATTVSLRRVSVVNSGVERVAHEAFLGLEDLLEHLDLSGNKLEAIPSAVLNLTRLLSLDVSRNRIRTMPHGAAFNNLNTLVRLDLANNRLGEGSSPGALGLLAFNVEPLTDSLEELSLRDNGLAALPRQLEDRSFVRLRRLDLAGNPLAELSSSAFSGLTELESLNVESCGLRTLSLPHLGRLREVRLGGNPLACDCRIAWLWDLANRRHVDVDGAVCATPFANRNARISHIKEDPCSNGKNGTANPRFFRVSDLDVGSFSVGVWDALALDTADSVSDSAIDVTWRVRNGGGVFVDGEEEDRGAGYSWCVVYRQIADDTNVTGLFFKTRFDTRHHNMFRDETQQSAGGNGTELSSAFDQLRRRLAGFKEDTFYEICLALVDENGDDFYLHKNNCKEVRTKKAILASHEPNVTLISDVSSITVVWSASLTSNDSQADVVRRISLREFGTENMTQLLVIEDQNAKARSSEDVATRRSRYYTLPNLKSGTAYVACFDTVATERESAAEQSVRPAPSTCKEIRTQAVQDGEEGEGSIFPVTEVLAAAAVSAAATAVFVVIICCCCFPGMCRGKRKAAAEDKGAKKNSKSTSHKAKLSKSSAVETTSDTGRSTSKDENDNPRQTTKETRSEALTVAAAAERKGEVVILDVEGDAEVVIRRNDDDNDEDDYHDHHKFMSSSVISVVEAVASANKTDKAPVFFHDRFTTAREVNGGGGNSETRKFWQSCLPKHENLDSSQHHKNGDHKMEDGIDSPDYDYDSDDDVELHLDGDSPFINPNHDHDSHHHHHHHQNCGMHDKCGSCSPSGSTVVAVATAVDEDMDEVFARRHHHSHHSHPEYVHDHVHHHKHYLPSSNAEKSRSSRHHRGHHEHGHRHLRRQSGDVGLHPPRHDDHVCVSAPRFLQHHLSRKPALASLGPGSYHTVGNYQIYDRAPQHQQQQMMWSLPYPAQPPLPEMYHVYRPGDMHKVLNLSRDYAKTLGRKRRESPMAMMPVRLPPALALPPPPFLEMPSHLKRKATKAMAKLHAQHRDDAVKMYTWSPYSSSLMYTPDMLRARGVFGRKKGADVNRSLEELRF